MKNVHADQIEELLYRYIDRSLKSISFKRRRKRSPDNGKEKSENTELFEAEAEAEEFLEEIITYRISCILFAVHQKDREKAKTGADLIESVSPEIRGKMEKWVDSCLEWAWKDSMAVYQEAFRDGMRLAKKIFA